MIRLAAMASIGWCVLASVSGCSDSSQLTGTWLHESNEGKELMRFYDDGTGMWIGITKDIALGSRFEYEHEGTQVLVHPETTDAELVFKWEASSDRLYMRSSEDLEFEKVPDWRYGWYFRD